MPAQDDAWKPEHGSSSSSFTPKHPASSEGELPASCTKAIHFLMSRWASRRVLRCQAAREPWLAGGPPPGGLLGASSGARAGSPLTHCRRLSWSDLGPSDRRRDA